MAKALAIPRSSFLVDGRAPTSPREGIAAVYVDNFVFTSTCRASARHAVGLVEAECARRGLPTHGKLAGYQKADVLGWSFDGVKREIRVSPARAWRLWLGLDEMLRRNHATSKEIEVLIGHFTFCALIRRCTLSTMSAIYAFASAGYLGRRRLWDSVSREIRWMRDVLVLLVGRLDRPQAPGCMLPMPLLMLKGCASLWCPPPT